MHYLLVVACKLNDLYVLFGPHNRYWCHFSFTIFLVFAKWKYLLQVAKPTQNPHHIKLCQKTSDTTNQLLPHKE